MLLHFDVALLRYLRFLPFWPKMGWWKQTLQDYERKVVIFQAIWLGMLGWNDLHVQSGNLKHLTGYIRKKSTAKEEGSQQILDWLVRCKANHLYDLSSDSSQTMMTRICRCLMIHGDHEITLCVNTLMGRTGFKQSGIWSSFFMEGWFPKVETKVQIPGNL